MDADLMLIFGFILTIASLGMVTGILIHRSQIRADERKLELKAQIEQARAEQARFQKGDYSKVEERLRVLERIATDSNHALASQIDELRALNAVEDKREPAS